MSVRTHTRRPAPPGLFEPPRSVPTWQSLPPQTRQAVLRLLTKLLQDQPRHQQNPAPSMREVDDE